MAHGSSSCLRANLPLLFTHHKSTKTTRRETFGNIISPTSCYPGMSPKCPVNQPTLNSFTSSFHPFSLHNVMLGEFVSLFVSFWWLVWGHQSFVATSLKDFFFLKFLLVFNPRSHHIAIAPSTFVPPCSMSHLSCTQYHHVYFINPNGSSLKQSRHVDSFLTLTRVAIAMPFDSITVVVALGIIVYLYKPRFVIIISNIAHRFCISLVLQFHFVPSLVVVCSYNELKGI